jgi:hypothetical protein
MPARPVRLDGSRPRKKYWIAELEEHSYLLVVQQVRLPTDGATALILGIRNNLQHYRLGDLEFVRPTSASTHVVRERGKYFGTNSRLRIN